MDNTVLRMYKRYGLMVNSNRMLPLDIDGCKPVERRLLVTLYQLTKDKFTKCARVDGEVTGKLHPHGSCYGSLVQLWYQGFIDEQGNFGNKYSIEESPPAASRYTECRIKKETINLMFRLIDYVPWKVSEIEDPDIKEPEFLPTKYPVCLMGNEFVDNIGFGFRTVIPAYKKEDLKQRLMYLLGKTKTKPTIKPITNCQILSSDKDLEELLTTGKMKISFKGVFKIDPSKSKVIIKAMPPSKGFESLLNKFETELNNQDIGWRDESAKMNDGTHIVFEVLKSRNRDLIFKTFVKKLDDTLQSNISFNILVVDHETKTPKLMSVDDMLLKTYNMYKNTNEIMLKSEESRFKSLINENKLIQKIKPSLSKQLQSKETDVDKIIDAISNDTFIDRNVVKELIQKHRISKLLSVKDDLKELETKIVDIQDCIKNLDDFVMKQYS